MKSTRYWYFTTTEYCPVCGHEKAYRERRYTLRPTEYWDRNKHEEVYDWCDI